MANSTRNIILILIGGLLLVGLCGVVGAGTYWLGLRTAATQDNSAISREEPPVTAERAEEEPEAPPEPEPEASATPEPITTVAPTETVDPSATPLAEEPPVAQPTSPPPMPTPGDGRQEFDRDDLELFWEVWNIVQSEYDGAIPDDEDLTYAAIEGLLESLGDDYTRFAPPDLAARMRESLQGSFEGIGAFVNENEEGLTEIVRPMAGQPAAIAGLRAGDVVIGVDGESVIGQSLDEVIAQIRGPEGTEVNLTIRREGEEDPLEFTVQRQLIEIPVIESEMLEDDIAYVRLTSFNRNADTQLRETMQELLAQDPTGLVLDLRDNPGGLLDQTVSISDYFLPEGVVLFERSSTFDLDQEHRSVTGDAGEDIPMVVLVNAASASASEIVAGAIQDRDRGVLIGETTFGKGSVQVTHALSDDSELRVTIARWYTPNNQSIDGNGIAPDIEVPTPTELGGDEDPQLQRAVEYLLTGE
ncbi:MAG: S41 family peptidase [Chloroflexota bacterium]